MLQEQRDSETSEPDEDEDYTGGYYSVVVDPRAKTPDNVAGDDDDDSDDENDLCDKLAFGINIGAQFPLQWSRTFKAWRRLGPRRRRGMLSSQEGEEEEVGDEERRLLLSVRATSSC